MQQDGRYSLLVDGRPFLILGGQIHNSSAWPSELPQVWESMAALHANTLEAPVYWEQMEPKERQFNFDNVDQIVAGARAHDLRVVLLWFGTWKNGNMHYVPGWVKRDAKRFPRVIRPDGEPIDVLSPPESKPGCGAKSSRPSRAFMKIACGNRFGCGTVTRPTAVCASIKRPRWSA